MNDITPHAIPTRIRVRTSVVQWLKSVWPGPVLFLFFWLGMLAGSSRFLRDPGQFWHTRTGEILLTEGFFNRDRFTFTFADEKWIPHQWLGEVIMARLYRVGRFDTLLVVTVGILAALYSWLGSKFIRTGLHPIFVIVLILLALAAASTHFHVRPHLFTMVGMAVTMHTLIEFENGRIDWKRIVWLIPLYLVWSNIHGGMLGGLTTVGLAGFGWIIWRFCNFGSPIDSVRSALRLVGIGLACGLTAFLNPYGADIPKTWLYINSGMSRLPEIIAEHARLDVTDSKAWPLLMLGGIYLILLAGVLPSRMKVVWLVPIFWLVQAILRVRHGALFAPVTVLVIIDLWPHTRYARWLALKRPDVYSPPTTAGTSTLLPVLLTALLCGAISIGLHWNKITMPLIGSGCAQLDPKLWPSELLDDLKRLEPRATEPNRIFCEYIFGGYLIQNTPGYRLFVDDRCELFGDEWLVKFVEANDEKTAEAMTAWQKQYGSFDFALTSTDDRTTGYDWYFRTSSEWTLIRKTDTASFYQRK
jgi:hypothetical protein